MGHVAAEVWSNEQGKWIFVDPQFGIYAKSGNEYLNFYDMYLMKKEGKFDTILFIPLDRVLKARNLDREQVITGYKAFISGYFGYMDSPFITGDNRTVTLTLPLEARHPFLTFQGGNSDNLVFTGMKESLYSDINRVMAIFTYREKPRNAEVARTYSIKTGEDYTRLMPLFAAEPKFRVSLEHSMPWFHHYEFRINESLWRVVKNNSLDWELREGVNRLKIRGVNSAGHSGPEMSVTIGYE
jgi:hypothetical protein